MSNYMYEKYSNVTSLLHQMGAIGDIMVVWGLWNSFILFHFTILLGSDQGLMFDEQALDQ